MYHPTLAHIHDQGFGTVARAAARVLLGALAGHRGLVRDLAGHRGLVRDLAGHSGPVRDLAGHSGLVRDLACGSGLSAETWTTAGLTVHGTDLSPAMVQLARHRVPSATFDVGSLWTAELAPCQAVTVIGEGLCYVSPDPTEGDLRSWLARVHAALVPGGLLLFDVATPDRVPEAGRYRTWTDGPGWLVAVDAEGSRDDRRLTRRIVSFQQDGDTWRRDEEIHRMRLWPAADVLVALEATGFSAEILPGYEDAALPTGVVAFLARKPQF